MIADLHLHTRLSNDADQSPGNTVSGYVNTASERGIKYIAITEHYDIYLPEKISDGSINADLDECALQIKAEKEKLSAETNPPIRLLHGVELAHANIMDKEATEVISAHKYDFILGSHHILKDGFDFYLADYANLTDAELLLHLNKYLAELYDVASKCDFDSFAHCTYPLRYFRKNKRLLDLCNNPAKKAPQYADIFKTLISRGKALEVNTSELKFGGVTLPTPDLIKLYYDLGGRLITTGSDSHSIQYVGSGIETAENILREIGFEGITVFENRTPKIIPFKN